MIGSRLRSCCDLQASWILNALKRVSTGMCGLHYEALSLHGLQACEDTSTDLKSQLVMKQAAVENGRRLKGQLEV